MELLLSLLMELLVLFASREGKSASRTGLLKIRRKNFCITSMVEATNIRAITMVPYTIHQGN